jgi:hypothetical protein
MCHFYLHPFPFDSLFYVLQVFLLVTCIQYHLDTLLLMSHNAIIYYPTLLIQDQSQCTTPHCHPFHICCLDSIHQPIPVFPSYLYLSHVRHIEQWTFLSAMQVFLYYPFLVLDWHFISCEFHHSSPMCHVQIIQCCLYRRGRRSSWKEFSFQKSFHILINY